MIATAHDVVGRALVASLIFMLSAVLVAQNSSFPPPDHLWAAQTSPTEITLSWSRVPGALSYRLYAIDKGAARLVSTLRATGDRSVQRVVDFGAEHTFAIEAIAENGTVSPRVLFNVVVPVKTTPGATPSPASVEARIDAPGVIAVSWTPVPGATAYMIGRAVAPGGYRVVCPLCPASTTTYVDGDTTPGAKHSYSVVALTPQGASRASRSGEVTPVRTVASKPATTPDVADPVAPKGTIKATPRPGSCLALGAEGNFIVRLADGSVRIFERVQFRRPGASFVREPKLAVVPGISDAVAVATSGRHWLVLRSDGTVVSWGLNGEGQLGSEQGLDRRLGRPIPRPVESPVPVREIINAVALAAGAEHSVALLADGTIRTWGSGLHGIPGDGALETIEALTPPRLAPARVVGIDKAVAVAASGQFSLALLADGGIRAWGRNDMLGGTHGVLGTGNDESTATPLPVVGITKATGIAAGTGGVAAAVLADGTVRAWGYGYGKANAGGRRASNTPLPIKGISDAVAISTYMALLRDGTVREFPDGFARWTTPKLSNVVAIASDHVNRLALLADGRLVAWGHKEFYPNGLVVRGELGAETARQCAAPVN